MSEAFPFPAATPVQFSSQLLEKLDASTESTLSREQRKASHAAREKGAQLENTIAAKKDALTEKLNNSSVPDANPSISSTQLSNKLDEIADHLRNSAEAKLQKSPALLKAENDVTQCFLANKGKPLKCWDEVQIFKKLAGV